MRRFVHRLKQNGINVLGKKIHDRVIVIESDDWGSIRMPSKRILQELEKRGYEPKRDPYLRFDSLASEDDLSALFDSLRSVRDCNGSNAKITANCLIANPDFNRIKENDFKEYHYELFTTTLSRYPSHQNSFGLWKEGIKEEIFKPQFHGREHLNVFQWMKSLSTNEDLIREAFDLNMISISSVRNRLRFAFMEGLDFFSREEQKEKIEIVKEGHLLFHEIFGYHSKSFIANCYIWDHEIEKELQRQGVNLIQGISNQIEPVLEDGRHHRYKFHYQGEKNSLGQRYLVRNAFFEPSLDPDFDWVSDCLARIRIAFFWGKPAIIGSHRLNFIGFINEKNRIRNLSLFRELLKRIKTEWPDSLFLTSDELEQYYFTE